ncbi:MAG: response regulator [Gallionellaceae bacterium]
MSQTILIIDDDEIIRLITQDILEQSGYLVETAEDGLAGWEKIDREPSRFALILLDKQMPRLNGIGLLRQLKADSRFDNLPIVMLTGDNSPDDIKEGLAAGAHYYLTKPSPHEVITQVVKNTLDTFNKRREINELAKKQIHHLSLLQRAEYRYRTLDEAKDLALVLAEISENPTRTVNGYLELLINAVEHGNLGITYVEKSDMLSNDAWEDEIETRLQHPNYADRTVHVTFERTPEASTVTITDEGTGFNWHDYLNFSPERVFDLHGRGIAMSKQQSFDALEYQGNGNCVVTTVKFMS